MAPGKIPRNMMEEDLVLLFHNEEHIQKIKESLELHIDSNIDLIPPLFPGPKYKPGDILNKIDYSDINDALRDVLKAGSLLQSDRAAIGHANEAAFLGGTKLENPRWYLNSGTTHSSLALSVSGSRTSLMLFTKKSLALAGTSGVYTYDIEDTDYKVAVMWSVPYYSIIYNRYFNIKVYPKSYETGKDMYNQMYYYAGPWLPLGYENRDEFGIKNRGTMLDNAKSRVVVWSDPREFDEEAGPSLYTECRYHTLWFGRYCWQECHPTGWCWTNEKCSSDFDCQGPMECRSNC
jgi:hypothetical protein